jgi:thioredoxin
LVDKTHFFLARGLYEYIYRFRYFEYIEIIINFVPIFKATRIMVEFLTKETFKEKVFDFENNKDWKFEGEKPCLIDFYADWCQPCKMVAPILEELSEEYDGKVDIYKIDTEAQQELAGMFGIQSIPSLLFVPTEGQPQMAQGALPKDTFERAIKDVLKVEK